MATTTHHEPQQNDELEESITQNDEMNVDKSDDAPSYQSLQIIRQKIQDKLYQLIQDRCSVQHPKTEAVVLEKLLFQSMDGNTDSYLKILQDSTMIKSKLKEVGKRILLRKLQRRKHGGFRSTMVLTSVPKVVNTEIQRTSITVDHSNLGRLEDHDDDLSSCITTEKSFNGDADDDDDSEHTSESETPDKERQNYRLLESLQISSLKGDSSLECRMDYDELGEQISNVASV